MVGFKYAIYCLDNNLDAFCSAAIIARLAKLRGYGYKLGFLNYATVEEDFKEVSNLDKYLIFILDYSPEQIPNLANKLVSVNRSNKLFYWNSHHPFSSSVLESLQKHVKMVDLAGLKREVGQLKLVQENKLCSADLSFEKFLKNDPVARELSKIAHDSEFWLRKDERSKKLNDMIASGYDKKKLIETLAKGIFWSDTLEKLRKEYIVKKEIAYQKIMKRLVVKDYVRKKFGYTFSPSILSTSDAGNHVLENSEVDVSVVLYKDGRISFRRKDFCDIDLTKVAELFGGGGHNYAAGGRLVLGQDVPMTNLSVNDFDRIVFSLERKIRGFFGI